MLPNIYAGVLQRPSDDFNAVRDGRVSTLKYQDIDLSVARSDADAFVVNASGNSFYIDANPTDGNAFVEFQDSARDGATVQLYASPGFIANLPFTYFKIVNAAQAGKKIRIAYGVDIDFQPGSIAQIAVTNAGGFTAIRPEENTGFFSSTDALASLTPQTIFTPAQNPNGAYLLTAGFTALSASVNGAALIAHAAPPAVMTDGEIIVGHTRVISGATQCDIGNLFQTQFIPAGKGLYFMNEGGIAAGSVNLRHARWKAL